MIVIRNILRQNIISHFSRTYNIIKLHMIVYKSDPCILKSIHLNWHY